MKRVAAIVLPRLACELAQRLHPEELYPEKLESRPFACIVDDDEVAVADDPGRALLDAVSPGAWRYGARPGQRASEASAFVGQLRVVHLSRAEVVSALEAIAEIALGYGTTAALTLDHDPRHGERALPVLPDDRKLARFFGRSYPTGAGAGPLDTVWLDVSGCARLAGGEDLLVAELEERARQLGHHARVAIAGGPRIAQAIARWQLSPAAGSAAPSRQGEGGDRVIPSEPREARRALSQLPIAALPLDPELLGWLGKLGIFSVGDLARIDRARLAHRLGAQATDVLELIAGRDPVPLCAYQPPREVVESAAFEEELSGTEPLLFVLRGLLARAVGRLTVRGEACTRASLELSFDRGVVALSRRQKGRQRGRIEDGLRLDIELPIALAREEELLTALRAKLERLELPAPVIAVTLRLDNITRRSEAQLDVLRQQRVHPNAFPLLLAELSSWLGADRVGVLQIVDSHRPETRSRLQPIRDPGLSSSGLSSSGRQPSRRSEPVGSRSIDRVLVPEPTRILGRPVPVGKLTGGALVGADHNLYVVDRLRLSGRIDRVEWWTGSPVSRDYARAWLRTGIEGSSTGPDGLARGQPPQYAEAWVFIDRAGDPHAGFLHGWYE